VLRERWWSRVVPVTALAVGLVALLAVLLPGIRHQVALSASHQPQEYVGLAFGHAADGTVVTCAGAGDRLRVAFDVSSHLDEVRDLRYVVSVAGHDTPGSVTVDPGETASVVRDLDRPSRDSYEVRVELPGEDRQVFAHCPGTAT
jgi:hypothetical protein